MSDSVPRYPLLALSRLRMQTDGAGVTTLVAGAGCPLRCKWCINKRLLAEKTPEPVTPEALFERTRIDDLYFQATGGGLCFGGGEALLHADFIAAFRTLTGGVWKLTAETSLNVPPRALETALGCVDAFIVDVKAWAPDAYRRYTGGDTALVRANLEALAAAGAQERVRLRVPLIPGYQDAREREACVSALRALGFRDFDLFEYRIG